MSVDTPEKCILQKERERGVRQCTAGSSDEKVNSPMTRQRQRSHRVCITPPPSLALGVGRGSQRRAKALRTDS